jgi:hypothetical protein
MIDLRDEVQYEPSPLLDEGIGLELKQVVEREGFPIDLAERLARHLLGLESQEREER